MFGVDLHSVTIANSYKLKVHNMHREWYQRPFKNILVKYAKGGGYNIRHDFKKLDCENYDYGRGNTRHVGIWCANRCRKQDEI